jgi:endonuclease/exonuclease/phosphatase (EEP) superfamily protein YafD
MAIDLQARATGLLQAGALFTTIFSVATLASHLHRYLELFSHFRLQYLAVAALLSLTLFVLHSRRWAALMLTVAMLNVVPVYPWYVAGAQAAVPSQGSLRVLLSNVYAGNDSLAELIDLVASEEADIVFLQEVTPRQNRELAALRGRLDYSLNIPREDNFGIAVLSRLPFQSARVIQSPPHDFPTLVVEVVVAGTPVTFVTTHPVPPLGKRGFSARNEQLASIAELLNDTGGARVLIGDLNTTMWGHHYDQLIEATGLVNARYGFGVQPSWPTSLPFAMIPIDHCLVSPEVSIVDVRTGPDIGSDHLPLIVDLGLPAP